VDAAGAEVCLERAPEDEHWCGQGHPGQTSYTAESGAAVAARHGVSWSYREGSGWGFCNGATLGKCLAGCVEMGSCAELSFSAAHGCCFPATEPCAGEKRPSDNKYVSVECVAALNGEVPCALISGRVQKQEYKAATGFEGNCIEITEDVTSIGEQAFEDAHIDVAAIPASVTEIGKQAFKALNDQQGEALFVWGCDPCTGAWPILESGVSEGDDWLQDTVASHQFSCALLPSACNQQLGMWGRQPFGWRSSSPSNHSYDSGLTSKRRPTLANMSSSDMAPMWSPSSLVSAVTSAVLARRRGG